MTPMTPVEFESLRKKIGTQAEAAEEMDVNLRTIGRWERGQRPIPYIAALALRHLATEAEARKAATFDAAREMGAAK